MNPGDKIIYSVKSDGWNSRTKKSIYAARQYSYFGVIVEIGNGIATLDLEHPKTKEITRKTGCPIRNIKKVEV